MRKRKYRRAASDYTETMLPQTRREVFSDVFKLHWFDLLKLGLLLLASFLPLLMLSLTNDLYEARLLAELPETASAEAAQAAAAAVLSFQSTSALLGILCYLVIAVAFSGALRVIRQLAYEEVLFFRRDFLTGIRQNVKPILLIALLMGLQKFIGIYLSGSGQLAQGSAVGFVGAVFNALSLLVFLPIWAYMTVLTAIYDNTFRQNFKLAFTLYAKAIGRTLLLLLVLGLLFALSVLPYMLAHLLGKALGALLLPTLLLIWFLFVLHQLDMYINPIFFPELVGKGLYQPERGEDDDSDKNSKGETAP